MKYFALFFVLLCQASLLAQPGPTPTPGSFSLSPDGGPLWHGYVGVSYQSENITAPGATLPINWSVSAGTLPPGTSLVQFASGGCSVWSSPYPTQAGTWLFDLTATDATPSTVTRTFAIVITGPGDLAITTGMLADGDGSAYAKTIWCTSTTAPYDWSVVSGQVPPGLALDVSKTSMFTTLSGTPTQNGTFQFTVRVEDAANNWDEQPYTIAVTGVAPSPPAFTPTTTPAAVEGTLYNVLFNTTAGQPPFAWTLDSGALPPGLSLQPATSTDEMNLAGTPTSTGVYAFAIRLTDDTGASTAQSYDITVAPAAGQPAPPSATPGTSGGGAGCAAGGGAMLPLVPLLIALRRRRKR